MQYAARRLIVARGFGFPALCTVLVLLSLPPQTISVTSVATSAELDSAFGDSSESTIVVSGGFDVGSSLSFSARTKSLSSAWSSVHTLSYSSSPSLFTCDDSGSLTLSYLELNLFGASADDGVGFHLVNEGCAVTISYCTIRNAAGTSSSNGGVMYIGYGTVTFEYSTFTSNSGGNGGVVYVEEFAILYVGNSWFTSNEAMNVRCCLKLAALCVSLLRLFSCNARGALFIARARQR